VSIATDVKIKELERKVSALEEMIASLASEIQKLSTPTFAQPPAFIPKKPDGRTTRWQK
jgi:hypothetical protein